MKKLTALFVSAVVVPSLLSVFSSSVFAQTPYLQGKKYCDPAAQTVNGIWTINTDCVLYEDSNGAVNSDISITNNTTITIHANKNLVWYPGKKIDIAPGSHIIIPTGGKIVQQPLCVRYTTIGGLKYALGRTGIDPITGQTVYLGLDQQTPGTPGATDCSALGGEQAGWTLAQNIANRDVIASSATNDSGVLATSYRYFLNLGMAISSISNGTKAVQAANNLISILGDNLKICITTPCIVGTPGNYGNLIVERNVGIGTGIGAGTPTYKLEVSAGDSSLAMFGPNTSWSGKLLVGAAPNQGVPATAQVLSTDGNLHLDPASSKNLYLGYYQPNNIFINGGSYYLNANTSYLNALSLAGVITAPYHSVTAGNGYGICFWTDCTNYKIHMGNSAEYWYGPVTEYAIKTNMGSGSSGRGWVWGTTGVAPVAAINVSGAMQIAGNFTTGGSIVASGGTLSSGGLNLSLTSGMIYMGAANWYTVGYLGGGRAYGEFIAENLQSGQHQVLKFSAAINYGNGASINILHNSWYGNQPFTSIRIARLSNDVTYGAYAVQVYGYDLYSGVASRIRVQNPGNEGWSYRGFTTNENASVVATAAELAVSSYTLATSGSIKINNEIYVDNWVRHPDSDGTYWSATGHHIYVKDSNDFYLRSGSATNIGIALANSGGGIYGYTYADAGAVGLLNASRAWRVAANDTSTTITTAYGYVQVGPQNASWSHFQTDRANFYFNKGIHVDGGLCTYGGSCFTNSGGDMVLSAGANQGLTINNSNATIQAGGNNSLIIQTTGGGGTHFDSDTTFYFRDQGAADANRFTIDSANGNTWTAGTMTMGSISSTDQMIENPYGSYIHIGGWGVARTAATAVLVNTAYMADRIQNDSTNMAFHWSGQGGQPTWLWGGNSATDMYVWNPSNFSVNYANSAGSVTNGAYLTGAQTFTGKKTFQGAANIYNNDSTATLEVMGTGSGGGASPVGIAFHRPGAFATKMVLETDNLIHFGGWSDAQTGANLRAATFWQVSDERLKKNIATLPEDTLEKVLKLRGVYFEWKTPSQIKGATQRKVGVIAQEVEKLFPEVVQTGADGYKAVEYGYLTPVLIEAIKEQQTMIENQQKMIENLETELKDIKQMIINLDKEK